MRKLSILIIFVLLLGISMNAQSYKIIVNNSNTITSLSSKEVSDFFLKKEPKWNTGQQVVPVDLNASNGARIEFSKNILKKSISAVKSYWQQSVFAGKSTPPVEKKTDEEVIEYVKRNSGSIGYVSSTANLSGVKEIKVTN